MTQAAGWYHLHLKTLSRSHGRSAVAAAAYRLGARLEDERARIVHDYRARGGVEATFTVARPDAPDWVHDPERLWNAAEQAERRINSTLAREIELALPAIVTDDARLAITEAMATTLVERYGVAVSAAIHRPSAEGDQRNHHAHILFTTRVVDAGGFGEKTRILDDRKSGVQETHFLREYACQLLNDALADAGSDERVDHRSFEARGIDREPTQHLGPDATEIMRQGRDSLIAQDNDAVRERNADRALLDDLQGQLADLDAEIAQLEATPDTQAEDVAEALYEPGDNLDPDAVFPVGRADHAAIEVADAPLDTFDTIHAQTVEIARANEATSQQEEAVASTARFERVRGWWQNLCGHFSEWRDQFRDYVQGFGLRQANEEGSNGFTSVVGDDRENEVHRLGGAAASSAHTDRGAPPSTSKPPEPEL